ncbi:MAG TPA: DinB family protein [Thermoanaerobaculia bacterium]|nr:DinB family protein [Thermoanaerobaculia bacterium]
MKTELENFNDVWEHETAKTIKLFESLPREGYDFRPDPEGRSLGELAWHLAEVEAYGSFGIERGGISPDPRPPGLQRPKTVVELGPGFERIHRDAVARVKKLRPEDLDRSVTFFSGQPIAIRDVLWDFMLLHGIHHRGQLAMLCRQSGGRPASLFGPTRETAPLRRSNPS